MAVATTTVTAKAGPGIQATAQVFTNCTDVFFDYAHEILRFTSNGVIKEFDFNSVSTITMTVTGAGGNATLTLS